MKVGELINELKKYDPSDRVLARCGDVNNRHSFDFSYVCKDSSGYIPGVVIHIDDSGAGENQRQETQTFKWRT